MRDLKLGYNRMRNTEYYQKNFSKRLKELIKEKKMTQRQLSERTGLTESVICHYVAGRRFPDGIVLCHLASALGVSVDYLIGETKEKSMDTALLNYINTMTPKQKELAVSLLHVIPQIVK